MRFYGYGAMTWDGDDDIEQHPAWCGCPDCLGGGNNPVASWDEPGMTFDGDAAMSNTVDEAVVFIKKMCYDIRRTIRQAFRQYNHFDYSDYPIPQTKEQLDMPFEIQRKETDNNRTQSGGRKSKGLPFLDAERDLGADKRRVKILWAGDPKAANQHGDWAVVTLKLQSMGTQTKRLWTLGQNNPALGQLCDAMGTDADRWKDRELWMWCDKNNPSETPYVRLEIIPTDQSVMDAAAATVPTATM